MGELEFMTALSSAVCLHRPQDHEQTSREEANIVQPKIVVLLGWVAARDAHLAKYVHKYQQLYASATILLVKAEVPVMASPSRAQKDISGAIPVIRATFAEQEKAGLLIHAFSNGGSCMLAALYDAYAASSKAAYDGILPPHVTIFDSTPSIHYSHTRIVASVLAGIPKGVVRLLISPIIHLLSLFWLLRIHVFGFPDEMATWAASHNNPSRVQEIRRIYIYSDVDAMVDQYDMEEHARQAEARGFEVKTEPFKGSPHVSHARSDERRYWGIVKKAWWPEDISAKM